MLDGRHFPAVLAFVGFGGLMPDKLGFGLRVPAFAQPCEVFGPNFTMQSPLPGERALPLAMSLLVTAPIVLLFRGELQFVVALRLAG